MASISGQDSFGAHCHVLNFNMKVDNFICPICIDLVYKPVVNACGHIFCFWCVQKAMNPYSVSYCPLCRMVFAHFPRICTLLHVFLKQAFPKEYDIRASEVREEECKNKMFSPSLGEPLEASDIQETGKMSNDSITLSKETTKTQKEITVENGLTNSVESLNSKPTIFFVCEPGQLITEQFRDQGNGHKMTKSMESSCSQTQGTNSKEANNNTMQNLNKDIFSLELFSCPACEDLLQQPVVFNCGHAICSGCINGALGSHNISSPYFCPSCKQQQPQGRLEVCLQLHEIIETLFPEKVVEWRERRRLASGKAAISNDDASIRQVLGSIEVDGKIPDRKTEIVGRGDGARCSFLETGASGLENTSENLSERLEAGDLSTSSLDCGGEGYNERPEYCGRQGDSMMQESLSNDDVSSEACKGDGEISLMQKSLAKVMAVQQKLDESESEEEKQILREVLEKTKREQYIHGGVGCDGCGAYPIVGPRYKCKQCPEAIGFDLCGVCFKQGVVLGRFNQRHEASHEMEEVPINPQIFGFLGSLPGMHPRTFLALLQEEVFFDGEE